MTGTRIAAHDVSGTTRPTPFVGPLDEVLRAERPPAVARGAARLSAEVAAIAAAGDLLETGEAISSAIDAVTRQLLDLGTAQLGEPPVPWAWLALGSGARREQGIVTDQDNALAFEPGDRDLEEVDGYFRGLATFVNGGLEAAGIPRCRADVVASNRSFRRPVKHWLHAFSTWMSDTRIQSLRHTAILFDHRRVAGPLEVEGVFRSAILSSPAHDAYIHRLLDTTGGRGPAWLWRVRRTLDVKHDGLIPVVGLARALALYAGIGGASTVERLRGAADLGLLDRDDARTLEATFRELWAARHAYQVNAVANGYPPREDIAASELTRSRRARVRQAMIAARTTRDRVVQAWHGSTMMVQRAPSPVAAVGR
jgi:CBS domain-containing protein